MSTEPHSRLRVLIAPDKFAGTMTATQAATAIAEGWARSRPQDTLLQLPMADGGEGTLDAVARVGAREVVMLRRTSDGSPVEVPWVRMRDGTGFVEAASVLGYRRDGSGVLEPRSATSAILGRVVADLSQECPLLMVGIGGVRTMDGGLGMLADLGLRFSSPNAADVRIEHPLQLTPRHSVTRWPGMPRNVVALADVTNPLLGPEGAVHTFGPQKGVCPDEEREFETALKSLVAKLGGSHGYTAGSGAGGGIGYAFARFGIDIRSGSLALAELVDLVSEVRAADVVVTGEGSLDRQSLSGKAPIQVAAIATSEGRPVLAIAGRIDRRAHYPFQDMEALDHDGIRMPELRTIEAAARLSSRLNLTRRAHEDRQS